MSDPMPAPGSLPDSYPRDASECPLCGATWDSRCIDCSSLDGDLDLDYPATDGPFGPLREDFPW